MFFFSLWKKKTKLAEPSLSNSPNSNSARDLNPNVFWAGGVQDASLFKKKKLLNLNFCSRHVGILKKLIARFSTRFCLRADYSNNSNKICLSVYRILSHLLDLEEKRSFFKKRKNIPQTPGETSAGWRSISTWCLLMIHFDAPQIRVVFFVIRRTTQFPVNDREREWKRICKRESPPISTAVEIAWFVSQWKTTISFSVLVFFSSLNPSLYILYILLKYIVSLCNGFYYKSVFFFLVKRKGVRLQPFRTVGEKKQVIFCKMSTRQTNSVIIFLPRLLYVCFLLGKQRDIPLSLSLSFFFLVCDCRFIFKFCFVDLKGKCHPLYNGMRLCARGVSSVRVLTGLCRHYKYAKMSIVSLLFFIYH